MADLDLLQIGLSLAVLLGSLTVHEAAHAWAADQLGDPTARLLGRLTLNPVAHVDPIGTLLFPLLAAMTGLPLIGWARPVPVDGRNLRAPRRDFALVAAAGPASNLVMAVVGALWLQAAPETMTGGPLGYALLLVVLVNVLLAVFNMLPIPPLDGGNVLIGVLPPAAAHAVERLRPYGIFVLYALMFSGVFRAIVGPVQERLLGWLL
ncbi:MAG: site-2 protease family protein [Vicinamibacterales bacterium]